MSQGECVVRTKMLGRNPVEVTVPHTSVHCVTADLLKMLTLEVNSFGGALLESFNVLIRSGVFFPSISCAKI